MLLRTMSTKVRGNEIKMSQLDRLAGTDGQRGRDREACFLSRGIKAGYVRVSSDRIKDAVPDPFSAHPHP